MSVTKAEQFWPNETAHFNEKGEREYVLFFKVYTNDKNDGPLTVVNQAPTFGAPTVFSVYSYGNDVDLGARCIAADPRRPNASDPTYWEVSYTFSSNYFQEKENPLDRPPDITWDSEKYQKIAYQDINGNALLNSAGMYFDPPIEIDDSRPMVVIKKNLPYYDPNLAITYQDAVNTDPFLIASAGQAKVAKITGHGPLTESDVVYWEVTYVIEFRREGWNRVVMDAGRYQKANSQGTSFAPIPEKYGAPVAEPVPLDGNGFPLSNPTPSTVKYMTFTVYKQLAFAPLGLP